MNNHRTQLNLIWLSVLLLVLTACTPSRLSLSRPNGATVAPDGSLYVMDKGNYRIVHFSAEGKMLQSFGGFGVRAQDIFYGWDIQIGPDNNLYICNLVSQEDGSGSDGVKVFSPQGELVRQIGLVEYSPDAEYTNNTYALFVDSQGRIYIADYSPNTVRVFSPQGELLTTLFAEEDSFQFGGLGDITMDEKRGYFYIADFDLGTVEQFRIQFDTQGIPVVEHLTTFGSYGREPGKLAFPQGITVDPASGQVYVGDQANRRIQVFDPQGRYVHHFAPPNVRDWQVLGLEIGTNGLLYAADALNNAIWVFSLEGELIQRIEVEQ